MMDFTESPIPACSNVGLACRLGDVDTVTRLIAAGAPVDVADNRGWLPIHEAVYSLHKECARIVLEHESG
jgi:ankyrin repeat/SOCS box protein 3